MPSLNDTIAAISTPVGEGGIGIVRLSGAQSLSILRQIFRPRRPRARLLPQRICHGHVLDPSNGETVDEALVSYMRAPRSYTREDVVEINCHGGIVPLRRVLGLTLRLGARLAEPGEFTLRAFVNGRLDLAQAEAVLDVIQAKTEAGLRVALGQLEGRLSQQISQVRLQLIETLAYLEATIDFAQEDIPAQDIAPELNQAIQALEKLLAQADRGIIYKQGVRVAIVGRPNVGKSSLLNALLRANRAIVTPIPGTTRDTLEETLNLCGIPLCLVDTAGIAETEDLIERLGIERSQQALSQADLALMVMDASQEPTAADEQIAALAGNKPLIVVVNKTDVAQPASFDHFLPDAPHVSISALTGEGLDRLEERIEQIALSGKVQTSEAPLISSKRHQDIAERALQHVREASQAHARGLPADFISIDVRAAINALGEITGESATEELLDTIFQRFCIGK